MVKFSKFLFFAPGAWWCRCVVVPHPPSDRGSIIFTEWHVVVREVGPEGHKNMRSPHRPSIGLAWFMKFYIPNLHQYYCRPIMYIYMYLCIYIYISTYIYIYYVYLVNHDIWNFSTKPKIDRFWVWSWSFNTGVVLPVRAILKGTSIYLYIYYINIIQYQYRLRNYY